MGNFFEAFRINQAARKEQSTTRKLFPPRLLTHTLYLIIFFQPPSPTHTKKRRGRRKGYKNLIQGLVQILVMTVRVVRLLGFVGSIETFALILILVGLGTVPTRRLIGATTIFFSLCGVRHADGRAGRDCFRIRRRWRERVGGQMEALACGNFFVCAATTRG